ncbi:MAG: family 10 glycosylhydrolase [Bernardetiaceae bacterium]|nr:family 10 glycosylhydrolase [Bernardetiaceae bacterium]
MKKNAIFVIFTAFFSLLGTKSTFSQVENNMLDSSPKRECRAVWIASVKNIDFPSKIGMSPAQQRAEFVAMLEEHAKLNINAVIVQIRPAADALYPSLREPWSQWLSGMQGTAPMPYYDPLDFMIKEAHKRGMEFHAWFNPFRAVENLSKDRLAAHHITDEKPEWFVTYANQKIFNPGIPEARRYVLDIIRDVVMRYDIDAVHLDDYFYPYPDKGVFNDSLTYKAAKELFYRQNPTNSYPNLGDWRRANINDFVKTLYKEIKETKPYVKLGISPFGVWRNRDKDPLGSPTKAGMTCYDDLYADVKLWLREGWLDYVVPQIYFSTEFDLVPYRELLDWWKLNSYGRHVYSGLAVYKIASDKRDPTWQQPTQMPEQVRYNRLAEPQVQGSVFYRSKYLIDNPLGIRDTLQNNLFRHKALMPRMAWIDLTPPATPRNLRTFGTAEGIILHWEQPEVYEAMDKATYYAIYRFEKGEVLDFTDPKRIIALHRSESPFFIDKNVEQKAKYYYVVTAIDRMHNESSPSNMAYIKYKKRFLKK